MGADLGDGGAAVGRPFETRFGPQRRQGKAAANNVIYYNRITILSRPQQVTEVKEVTNGCGG